MNVDATELRFARGLANLGTDTALLGVRRLDTAEGCDELVRAEARLFFRSAVLEAVARRRREIRQAGGGRDSAAVGRSGAIAPRLGVAELHPYSQQPTTYSPEGGAA
jgi:hypothetical protein